MQSQLQPQPQPNQLSKVLAQRYQILYEQYGEEDEDEFIISTIKESIDDWQDQSEDKLREDALFFLLVNSHQMLYKAYSAPVEDPDTGALLPIFLDGNETETRIKKGLEVVLNDLEDLPQPISGHQVMKSIDRNWVHLKDVLIWS